MSESGLLNDRRLEELEGCGIVGDGGGMGLRKEMMVREFKKLCGLIQRSRSKRDKMMLVEMVTAATIAASAIRPAGRLGEGEEAMERVSERVRIN